MKIGYAFRRSTFHPYVGTLGWELPPKELRPRFLRAVRGAGFEGIEVGLAPGARPDEAEARELRRELEDAGLECAAARGGGGFNYPPVRERNRQRALDTIEMAGWLGCPVVNMTVGVPVRDPHGPGASGVVGHPTAQGGSRAASEADFEVTARYLREIGTHAAAVGVAVAIEMHQNTIADNAWSCLHLLDQVDHPNVGVNPDLGNLYWTYDVPEETGEACIIALAPRAVYWHCKNFRRTHIPELQRSYFGRVPLPDGEIDYRFAVAAMHAAGYAGYVAVEGVPLGDQLTQDARSADYCRTLFRDLGVG